MPLLAGTPEPQPPEEEEPRDRNEAAHEPEMQVDGTVIGCGVAQRG